MKNQPLLIALAGPNLALLLFSATQSIGARDAPSVLRTTGLEVVDERGIVRARGSASKGATRSSSISSTAAARSASSSAPATTHITLKG